MHSKRTKLAWKVTSLLPIPAHRQSRWEGEKETYLSRHLNQGLCNCQAVAMFSVFSLPFLTFAGIANCKTCRWPRCQMCSRHKQSQLQNVNANASNTGCAAFCCNLTDATHTNLVTQFQLVCSRCWRRCRCQLQRFLLHSKVLQAQKLALRLSRSLNGCRAQLWLTARRSLAPMLLFALLCFGSHILVVLLLRRSLRRQLLLLLV